MFSDLIRRIILFGSPAILDYQATQDRCGQIHIYLEVPPMEDWAGIAQAIRAAVQATLASYECIATDIEITRGLLPIAAGAKRRRIWRTQATL